MSKCPKGKEEIDRVLSEFGKHQKFCVHEDGTEHPSSPVYDGPVPKIPPLSEQKK